MKDIQLVAFDVFGTIAWGNSQPGPYGRIAAELGIDMRVVARVAMTQNLSVGQLIDRLAPDHSVVERRRVERLVKDELKLDLEKIRLFPEVIEVFRTLEARGVQIALISNLAPPYAARIEQLLRAYDILPPVCIWSFAVGATKPEARIFHELFEQTGCSPSQTVIVGDRIDRDLLPPRELGCESRLVARPVDKNYKRIIEMVAQEDRIGDLRGVLEIVVPLPRLSPGAGEVGRPNNIQP